METGQIVNTTNGFWKRPIETMERDLAKLEKERDWDFQGRINAATDEMTATLLGKYRDEYYLLECRTRIHFMTNRTAAKVVVMLVGERSKRLKKWE